MNIKIERVDDQGRWQDEGQSALLAFKDAQGIDPMVAWQIDSALFWTGAYEGGGYRLTRLAGGLQ